MGGLIGLSAQAIELTFWLGNDKVDPGSTVEFTDITVDTYDTYKEVTMKPSLYVSSNIYTSDLTIRATCQSGQSIQMCAGGVCKGGESVTKENVTVRTGSKLDLGFDYIEEFDLDDKIPVVTTLFEAEDVTEPNSRVEFVLVMSEEGASLDMISLPHPLRCVSGGLDYELTGSEMLSVYRIDGTCVYTGEISGQGHLPLGIGLYVYSLGGDSGKLYVK